ncbi:MAG: NAD(P)-binding domain-containing protein [Planctomycetaceae bacterium]
MQHDIGLIGLAVMGRNLVLNIANHGYSIGVYSRTTETMEEFVGGLKDEPADKVWEGSAGRIGGYHKTLEGVRCVAQATTAGDDHGQGEFWLTR